MTAFFQNIFMYAESHYCINDMPQGDSSNFHILIITISYFLSIDFGYQLFHLNYLQHITFKGTQTKAEMQNINS